MKIRVGVGFRMDGLRQTYAQTIHGYYYFGLKSPFLYCLNCYCMRQHDKPMNTTTMLDISVV